jgi:surfeit locus 1 family protein
VNRLRQALILALGLVLAAGMVGLGLWQLDVYRMQGQAAAARRAAEPAVELRQVAPAGAVVREGYGRSVSFTGTYLTQPQELVPVADRPGMLRLVTPLRQSDGSVVAVVRGLVPDGAGGPEPPPPPSGLLTQTGILLPSDQSSVPTRQGVRVQVLAQRWPGPLVDGYVVLSAADSRAHSLEPATASLPEARGRLRNAAYALQWWVFAAFTVFMAIRMARDVGRGVGYSDRRDSEIEAVSRADAT